MTQFVHGPSRPASKKAGVNIYTALMVIALVALLCAIIFTWMRSLDLFRTSTPFEIVPSTSTVPVQDPILTV